MYEKDIENFDVLDNPQEQPEKLEQAASMLSFNSAEISDGLEEFEGLFDDQPIEETINEQPVEPVEEPKEEVAEEEFKDFEEETLEAPTEEIAEEIIEEQNEETTEILDSGFAEIFNNDSLSSDIKEEQTFQVKETENHTMTSDIVPDTSGEIFEDEEVETSQELITVRPVKFQQFENTPPVRSIKKNLDIMHDVSMHVSVELGRTKSSIREVMEMEAGSIVELDKIAGEQVEIFVNEKLVAKGEVIVIEDKFGVRVTSTNV